MTKIFSDLYQSTQVVEQINLSIHLYLLLAEEPVLIQTGAVSQAQETLPKLKELLGERSLKYILISHFEFDECGGIGLILNEYPDAVCVCSEITAQQLYGFGLAKHVESKKPGERLTGKGFDFQVIAYPSEVHMWEGILFMETERGIFFSSDLMLQFGTTHGQVIESSWADAVKASGAAQLPSPEMQQKMQADLEALTPAFVASGHGPCIKIVEAGR